jgi:hypothetical protein
MYRHANMPTKTTRHSHHTINLHQHQKMERRSIVQLVIVTTPPTTINTSPYIHKPAIIAF